MVATSALDVYYGQHDTKYVAFESLLRAAFIVDAGTFFFCLNHSL